MKQYTASEIATVLSVHRRQVYRWLDGAAPTGVKIVGGQSVDAWSLQAMPAALVQRLEVARAAGGYRSVEAMLESDSAKRWEPSLPIAEIAQDEIDNANKLRDALRAPLARRNDCTITAAEVQQLGMEEFKRVFGYAVKDSRWQRLFRRTLERAGASEEFERWELYLSERPRRSLAPADDAPADFNILRKVFDGFKNPPTDGDYVNLWQHAFAWFEQKEFEVGAPHAKRVLLKFLFAHSNLSKTESALRRNFDRIYRAWVESGRTVAALKDSRKDERDDSRAFTDDDIDIITHLACRDHRNEATPAVWAAFKAGKLSESATECLARARKNRRGFPDSLRIDLRENINLVKAHFQGPRAVNRQRAWIERDFSKVTSLYAITADDLTPPIVSYWLDGHGWYDFGRGQVLATIDFRSWCFLNFCASPDKAYNSFLVRELLNIVLRKEGTPKFFVHEGGSWDARIITGSKRRQVLSDNDFYTGLGVLGMRFIHARNPEAKLIEGAWSLLQDRMSGLPGFVGRNERFDRPEIVSKQMALVKAKKAHPGEFWMSFDEHPEGSPHKSRFGAWTTRLQSLCADFNNTPLFGRYHNGLTPEQVFERCKPKDADGADNPPVRLGPEHFWMFGQCIETTVRERTGISFTLRGERFRYFGEATGALIGQRVRAWFDPKRPELLPVTDLNNRNPFVVERANAVPALEAGKELSIELARAASHSAFSKAYFQHLKRKFEPTVRRMIPDHEAAEVARTIERHKEEYAKRKTTAAVKARNAEALAARGIPVELGSENPEAWAEINDLLHREPEPQHGGAE
jgi:hypothetical protein